MRRPADPLVGRLEELSVLDGALAGLTRQGWTAVELLGEPGIGKTRLLAELAARADHLGHLVLSGSASELERDLPFWVFVNALDDFVRGLDPRVLDRLGEPSRREIGDVLPSMAGGKGILGAAPVHERYRIHRSVRDLLEAITASRPLVLVLDDLHWADPASVELLGALLRSPPEAPVLLALAVRPGQLTHRLGAELEAAHRSEALLQLPLRPLTLGESQELLGSTVGGAATTTLYDECGGNPFYLEELARHLGRGRETSAVTPRLAHESNVPPAVAAALAEELALLSGTTRSVLQGAAVVGDPFEPELAAAASGVPESAALVAVDELLALGIIHPGDTPRRFGFRHPMVRRAVYDSAPAGWRLTAHEASAAALRSRGGALLECAHHVERSARKGDAAAVQTMREAGEATAHRAPESAARWFAAALRLLRDDAEPTERVELLLARADALATCGHFLEAHAALQESLDLVPPEAVTLRAKLTAACAGTEHLLGRHDVAHRRLEEAVADLDDPASPEAAALVLELALDGLYRLEFDQIRDQARLAHAAARRLDDRPLHATTAAAAAWGAALTGRVEEAEPFRAEAATLVDGLSDEQLAQRLDGAVHLAGAELYLDRFEAAGVHATRAITVARETGQPAFVPFAFMLLAWVRMLRGELADGAEMLDGAIEDARLLGNAQTLAGLLLNRSLTALQAGDLDVAVAAAREGVDLVHEMDDGLVPSATSLALAAALVESGSAGLADAVDLMVARCGGTALPLMPGGSFRAKWLELLTRCNLALGRRADAMRSAADAQAAAGAMGDLRMAAAMADRASAEVALDHGDLELCIGSATASVAAADEVGIPVEAAVSRTLLGRALAASGQAEQAAVELERAAAELDACGAVRYRDAAERELRRLGRRIHRRTPPGAGGATGVASLTRRERQVAELVVDRRTNAEIADVLFLSPKTVETHLHNIFGKVGVGSRVELARTVEAMAEHPS